MASKKILILDETSRPSALNALLASRERIAELEAQLANQKAIEAQAEASFIADLTANGPVTVLGRNLKLDTVAINQKAALGYVELTDAVKAVNVQAGLFVEKVAEAAIKVKADAIAANPKSKTVLVIEETTTVPYGWASTDLPLEAR